MNSRHYRPIPARFGEDTSPENMLRLARRVAAGSYTNGQVNGQYHKLVMINHIDPTLDDDVVQEAYLLLRGYLASDYPPIMERDAVTRARHDIYAYMKREHRWYDHSRPLQDRPLQDQSVDHQIDAAEMVSKLLPILTHRQRLAVELRYLKGMTLDKAAVIMNVTRERVRQIEAKAMYKLKRRAISALSGTSARATELRAPPVLPTPPPKPPTPPPKPPTPPPKPPPTVCHTPFSLPFPAPPPSPEPATASVWAVSQTTVCLTITPDMARRAHIAETTTYTVSYSQLRRRLVFRVCNLAPTGKPTRPVPVLVLRPRRFLQDQCFWINRVLEYHGLRLQPGEYSIVALHDDYDKGFELILDREPIITPVPTPLPASQPVEQPMRVRVYSNRSSVYVAFTSEVQQAVGMRVGSVYKLKYIPPNATSSAAVITFTETDTAVAKATETHAKAYDGATHLGLTLGPFCRQHGLKLDRPVHATLHRVSGAARAAVFSLTCPELRAAAEPVKQRAEPYLTGDFNGSTQCLRATRSSSEMAGISRDRNYLVTYDRRTGWLKFQVTDRPKTGSWDGTHPFVVRPAGGADTNNYFNVGRLLKVHCIAVDMGRRYRATPLGSYERGFAIELGVAGPVAEPVPVPAIAGPVAAEPIAAPVPQPRPVPEPSAAAEVRPQSRSLWLYHVTVALQVSAREFVMVADEDLTPEQVRDRVARLLFPLLPEAGELIKVHGLPSVQGTMLYQLGGPAKE